MPLDSGEEGVEVKAKGESKNKNKNKNKNRNKNKNKVKGSGQECPLHTSRSRFLTGLGARFGMTKS